MRIPATAFEQYVALGDGRSYQALSERIHISKRSIVKRASREGWQQKLQSLEQRAQEDALRRLGEDAAAIRERHLKAMRVVQAKALETLKTKPLETAMDAVRALALAQREERELVGAQATPGSLVGICAVHKTASH